LPCVEPYLSHAYAAASNSSLLDVLAELKALGVEPRTDGQTCWLRYEDLRKVPADLQDKLRGCACRLARMLAKNPPGTLMP
jgi:hypothetical protein